MDWPTLFAALVGGLLGGIAGVKIATGKSNASTTNQSDADGNSDPPPPATGG